MSFQVSDYSLDTFMSLRGLINKNNGFWKSAKQAKFAPKHMEVRTDYDAMEKYFGFRAPAGTSVAQVDGHYSWADYGSRSKVPGLLFFVLDDLGVVAQYKVGGNGNLREGWGPDPKKCKLVWSRPVDAEVPDFAKEYADMDRAEQEREDRLNARPVLEAGRRVIKGVIKSAKIVHSNFGYYGSSSLKGVIELENGNRVYGTIPSKLEGNVGDHVEFTATVTVSDDDVHFGFYSRPSKVVV